MPAETRKPRRFPAPSNPIRRWTIRLLTASIGILIGVLAVELSVRIYIATSRVSIRDLRADRPVASDPSAQITLADLLEPSGNPRLIYRLRPGTRGIFRGAEVEINSLGFRGPEFSRQKSPGTIRVAGLGDSSMFGWGVEDEQTYLRVLETELQRSFGSLARVEVINGGVSGYNAAQEVEYFHESLLELDPDLVLIQYDLNDTGVSHLLMDAQPWRLDYLYLGNLLEIARRRYFGIKNMVAVGQEGKLVEKFRGIMGWEALESAYQKLHNTCASRGIPLRAILPAHELLLHESDTQCNDARYDRFREMCRRIGIPLIETFETTVRCARDNDFSEREFWVDYPSDPHPNPLRHAIMASAIFRDSLEILGRGKISDALIEKRKRESDNIFLRRIPFYGYYPAQDWNGTRVRWNRQQTKVLLNPAFRYLRFHYFVPAPLAAANAPLEIRFRLDGVLAAARRHAAAEETEQWFDLGEENGKEHCLEIELNRVFDEKEGGRTLGIVLYPLEYSAEPPRAPSGGVALAGAAAENANKKTNADLP